MTEAYYFRQLDKAGQAAYHAMKTGLAALRPAFPVPRLEGRELGDVLARLRLDCPELFYVTGFSYRVHPAAATVELLPQYLFDKGKIQTHQKALAARLDRLCRPAMGLNEGEKERYVHDFICRNVRYDKLKKPYSHEILGPLGQGVGVCEGIAKAVKCLCDRLGVWCIVALAENNPDKGVKYRHAWNVVRLGDAYYHLDATFDNSLGSAELVRYDYFNLDDRRLFRDHEALVYPVPACADGGRFYYREAKLSFTRPEEVAGRAAQAVRKGKPLVFHWRGGPLTGEVLGELAALLEEAAARKGRHAEEPFPGRGKQRIGSGVPRFRLLAVCFRAVTFIHDVDLELHAFLKAAARRRERGRPRVQDQYRRKTAPQPGPCVLARLPLKRRYGLRARRFLKRLQQSEDRILNLHRRAAHGVTPSHGRVPGSSNTAPGVSVPAGGRPGMPALPSATSRSQLSALT